MKLTKEQIVTIKKAYDHLVQSLRCRNQGDIQSHDWHEHFRTIEDLENDFPEIIGEPIDFVDLI